MKIILSEYVALLVLMILPLSQCRIFRSCKNNGTLVFEGSTVRCDCFYPYSGKYCEDFECVNGVSTGDQFDPSSPFINKRCLCEPGRTGKFCERSLFDRCGDNGRDILGKCICRKNYSGDRCQYVTICTHGQLFNGRCACHYGWSGDFCDIIVCHHGFPDEERKSCLCPNKYRGRHCDFCAEPASSPPPECAEIGRGVVNIGGDNWPILIVVFTMLTIVSCCALIYYLCNKINRIQRKNMARQRMNDITDEFACQSTGSDNGEVTQPLNFEETSLEMDDPPPRYEDVVQLPGNSRQLSTTIVNVAQDDNRNVQIENKTLTVKTDNRVTAESYNKMLETNKEMKERINTEELQTSSNDQQDTNELATLTQLKIKNDDTVAPAAMDNVSLEQCASKECHTNGEPLKEQCH